MSLKMTACAAASLLWVMSGCGPAPVPESAHSVEVQAEVTLTAIPLSTNQPVLDATPILTSTAPPATATPDSSSPTSQEALPIPTPSGSPFAYHTIEAGETLSYLAWYYDISIEELVATNNLSGPEAIIQIGQSLRVPLRVKNVAPQVMLLPDSEVVYGPGYVDFDLAEFINSQEGYLVHYTEYVDGEELTGVEIVRRVSERFSVGPRLLLALLEHYGGWVRNPHPTETELRLPLGPRNPRGSSLYLALGFTANRINAGYYGYKRDGFWVFHLADSTIAVTPQGLNAGTVGVQNILAIHSDAETWPQELSQDGLLATYRSLFGDPAAYAVKPLVPAHLTQPPLTLPWAEGQGFYFTSGPHSAYVDGSAWAAVDFGPPDVLGSCFYSNEPVRAAAPGVVVVARQGIVELDLDGDGQIQTGWVLLYLHVALDTDIPVQVGQHLAEGDIIGYASCEGGLADSSHLHFARRYNGEWLDAGGPVPLNLGGWVVQPSQVAYEGTIVNGEETRESCECQAANKNLIVRPVVN